MIDAAEHYAKRMAEFATERHEPGGIAFVGTSHVELFPTDELLPGARIINRGIISDRIGFSERGILRRMHESIFGLAPRVVLLESGGNDLGELWRHGTPQVAEIEAGYRRLVAEIRAGLPEIPLCITGVMPACGRFAGLTAHLQPFNEVVRRIAADFEAEFIDMYPELVDADGLLCENLTTDGLHLSRAGYELWAERLRAYLSSLAPAR
jgi:lysophospholipase L1-like esterase